MELQSFTLGKKLIIFSVALNENSDDAVAAPEKRKVECSEAPLPELVTAFAKLGPVACEIMGWPKDYTEGLSIVRLIISFTKHGTRAVALRCKKPLQTIGGGLHTIDLPFVKIDKPQDGESGEVLIDKKSADLIKKALHECERYAGGERSQQRLDLESATSSEGINTLAKKGRNKDQRELAIVD